MAILKCENISKSYSGRKILDNVSFVLEEGERASLLALNGKGKTTLLRIITRLAASDSGNVLYSGKKIPDRNFIFFIPEITTLFSDMTLSETMSFFADLENRKNNDKTLKRILEKAGLDTGNRKIGKFSKGMRQKLALAMAALSTSPLVIIDEPLSGLDITGRKFFSDVSEFIRQKGSTLLFSSHDLEDVHGKSDKFIFLNNETLGAEVKPYSELSDYVEFRKFFEKISGVS